MIKKILLHNISHVRQQPIQGALTEFNGNSEKHTKRKINLTKPFLRYSRSKSLRFLRHPVDRQTMQTVKHMTKTRHVVNLNTKGLLVTPFD